MRGLFLWRGKLMCDVSCRVVVGFWQLWRAVGMIWKLKQSLIYLIGMILSPSYFPLPSPLHKPH